MGYDNGIITEPVGIYDVQRALGTNECDLGSLCRHNNINKWSKMKPVAFPYIEPDRTQAVTAYNKTLWWWKGHPSFTTVGSRLVIGNYTTTSMAVWITCCGVKFLGLSSKADVLGAFDPLNNRYRTGDNSPLANNFTYVPPTGGTSEPYRLVDFKNYKSNANYNVIPDYGTESGTVRVIAKNPQSSKVTCGIMCPQVSNTLSSELSFNDLFNQIGSGNATFTVVCGKLSGSTFSVVNLSVTNTRSDDYFKEIELNLNDSQVWNSTVLAIYCAYITINNTGYYVPLMQSTGDTPNTIITYAPKRKIYNSWYVDNNEAYYSITFTQKQNYGSSYAWTSVSSMTSFQTNGVMNRWYLKIAMPQKSDRTYSFGNNAFKIEFTGQFLNSRGQLNLVYYSVTSDDTRFVLKNNEVTSSYDWGDTESVTVTMGSGTQTCYLAMYNVFRNKDGVEVAYGGTIWRVRLFFLNGRADFSPEPDVVYGSLDSNHLNITVPAVS